MPKLISSRPAKVNTDGPAWAGHYYLPLVALSVAIYWVSVSAIPIYNKYFFNKKKFPYPIATAGIQLGVVAVLLLVGNIAMHFVCRRTKHGVEKSWVLGPHFMYKLKWCAPVGLLFGLKYSVTNEGLYLIDTQTHLLLQASGLVWTVIFSRTIVREKVSWQELLCCVGSVIGSVLLALHLNNTTKAPALGIVINFASPIILGATIACLRLGCKELMNPTNRLQGTMSVIEFTCIKLALSSTVALVGSFIFEGSLHLDLGKASHKVSWWDALGRLTDTGNGDIVAGVICGAFLVLIFQVNITFLSFLTNSISVGLVGEAKIVPQWAADAIISKHVSPAPLNIVGAILVMLSAASYALVRFLMVRNTEQDLENPVFVAPEEIKK
mmetsp:Transcript_624/g.1058  ORF Transcript_624/g.1058 Transcript_624/m.1058 type:complete len:382 (-) Transcript_624:1134-2279(-)|eukprot:CAMPEP_0203777232 /NCGR_PEP_ID=MMETSP0099_2-20121227/7267_1 /ASSEMBLY_ACC=CAM_ASM_000209 /TAXON_ID=96639 /ORGANISM=" , Strain NY0313808BC1" /LENGTH=381 /DNA_ID=CAMNT_0050676487 /DNA_START=2205 /DNA_END=3350 /DNA_ORIENTATION=-